MRERKGDSFGMLILTLFGYKMSDCALQMESSFTNLIEWPFHFLNSRVITFSSFWMISCYYLSCFSFLWTEGSLINSKLRIFYFFLTIYVFRHYICMWRYEEFNKHTFVVAKSYDWISLLRCEFKILLARDLGNMVSSFYWFDWRSHGYGRLGFGLIHIHGLGIKCIGTEIYAEWRWFRCTSFWCSGVPL